MSSLRSSPPPMINKRPQFSGVDCFVLFMDQIDRHLTVTARCGGGFINADQTDIDVRRKEVYRAVECLRERCAGLEPPVYRTRKQVRNDVLTNSGDCYGTLRSCVIAAANERCVADPSKQRRRAPTGGGCDGEVPFGVQRNGADRVARITLHRLR